MKLTQFLNNLNIPRISEKESKAVEAEIEIAEASNCMQAGKKGWARWHTYRYL